jgi:phosphate-selective porin OprO/OprP
MRKLPLSLVAAAILAGSTLASNARAQDAETAESIKELKQQVKLLEAKIERLESLNQQVKVIDRKLEASEAAQKERTLTMPIVQATPDGFFLKTPHNDYTLNIGGWIQADSRWFTSQEPSPQSSTFVMRRVRPYFQGTIAKYWDYRVLLDFGQGTATLQDAYIEAHYLNEFLPRMGKFKEPVGIERLQDDRYLLFVERALDVNLVPDRDIGAGIHGELFNRSLEYRFTLMNGVPDNTAAVGLDNNDGKDFAGRVFWHPFQTFGMEQLKGFGIGMAGTIGNQSGTNLDLYKTTAQSTFFTYNSDVYADGKRFRIAPQASLYYGPLSLYGEWVENWQELGRNFTTGPAPHPLMSISEGISNQAWQIAAGWVLTGENSSYSGVRPRHDFNPYSGSWGAFEIGARVDQLLVDRAAFNDGFANPGKSARQATEFAFGLNWYLNRNVKFMIDYEHTSFTLGASGGGNRPSESAILTELQLAY